MRKYKIVIIENDEDEQFFMKEGFDATSLFEIEAQLRSGDELLEWLVEHKNNLPDVILTDLNMPGKNGYDIIEMVQGNPMLSHIPVIVTSTSSTKMIMDRCFELGAADYLVKPETFIKYGPYIENLYNRIREKQLVK